MATLWEKDGVLIENDAGTALLECDDCPCDTPPCPCNEAAVTVDSWEWDVEMDGWSSLDCSSFGTSCTDFNDTFRLTGGAAPSPGVCTYSWTYNFSHSGNVCSVQVFLRLTSTAPGAPVYIEVGAVTRDCIHIFRSDSLGNAPIDCADISSESLTYHRQEDNGFGCGSVAPLSCPTVGSVTVQATRV